MLKLAPLVLAIVYGLLVWRFSAWRLKAELSAKSAEITDPSLTPTFARLAEALGVSRVPVRLYEHPAVNGLAAPDGSIYLTRGFYRKFRDGEVTAEELASVIAHELGHVALGHSRRRLVDFSGANAVRVVLTTVLGRYVPIVGIYLANLATSLLVARLSRQDEYEADEYASALLIKAGIGTGPQKSLFGKLEALTGSGAATPPAWLMSHPRTGERIAAIEANEAKWGGSRIG